MVLVQQQAHFFQLFAGEVFGAIHDDRQCRRLVDLLADKVIETLQIVLGLVVFAVVLLAQLQFVLVIRNDGHVFAADKLLYFGDLHQQLAVLSHEIRCALRPELV